MTGAARASKSLKIFFSYAREDKSIVDQLDKYLVHLKRMKMVSVWKDGELVAGQDWDAEIRKNLSDADIVLLMLSIDFLNSKYICETELKIAMDRHQRREAVIIPILLRPLPEGANPFPAGQGLPAGFLPIELWKNRDEAYVSVSDGIKAAVERYCATETESGFEVEPDIRRSPLNHIFCNRDEQEFEFVSTCHHLLRSRPGIPQVYVIRGEPLDRPDTLVERLFRGKIPALVSARLHEKRAGLRPNILQTLERELRWPDLGLMLADDYFQNANLSYRYTPASRAEEVRASSIVTAPEMQPFSFVVVRHDIDAGRLGEKADDFLLWYLNTLYQDLQGGPDLPQFLIFVNLILRERRASFPLRGWWRKSSRASDVRETIRLALERVCPKERNFTANFEAGAPGCPCKLLKELSPLEPDHIHRWVLRWQPPPTEGEAERESRRIFALLTNLSDGPVRLDVLAEWAEKERIYESV